VAKIRDETVRYRRVAVAATAVVAKGTRPVGDLLGLAL
jgi:hypothetical protein